MHGDGLPRRRNFPALALGTMGAVLALQSLFVETAYAIPVFARKYQTSCITCHTIYPKLNDVGEAFRRNGYQFPTNEDTLVKEEPIKLGVDAYKDMFPNSIWPSTLPSIPPVSVFTLSQNIVHLNQQTQLKAWDMAFPSDIELIGVGTFGNDISGFWNVGFTPANGASVGRVFVQFSNLFAWNEDVDEDGVHEGNRCAVLPPHAMNLRIGKIDPGVLPHVISEESFAQFPPLTNSFTLGQTGFILFAEQPAIELNGVIQQYWSYAVGIANGGSAVSLAVDDNTFKDIYFRVAHKWYGFPYDGVLGAGPSGAKPPADCKPDDNEVHSPGLDFWRTLGFETGVFGWFGKSNIPLTPSTSIAYDPNDHSTFTNDYFQRVGFDSRFQYFDLDIYGCTYWGHDPFPGFDQNSIAVGSTDHWGFMVEADYMIKPWVCAFVRYEQVRVLNDGLSYQDQARVIPGAVFAIRQNLHVSTEIYFNTLGQKAPDPAIPESTCQWITAVEWAF